MRKLLFPVLVALFSLVWSSAFIVAKVALVDFDPATILTLRFALSAALSARAPRLQFGAAAGDAAHRRDARLAQ